MEFVKVERLMELAKKFWEAWDNYEQKLNRLDVLRDNYEEEVDYDGILGQYEYELEESADELTDSFLKLSRKICPQNVSLVHSSEKPAIKKIMSILSKGLSEDIKKVKLHDILKEIRIGAFHDDIHCFAKFKLIIELPYFNPDAWFKNYTEVNPLVLSLESRLSKEIEKRLEEATFCHIYGFYNASTAICRSVLEGLLKKILQKEIPNIEKWNLEDMLRWLEKKSVKEQKVAWNVKKVRKNVNKILHNLHENMSKEKSKNILFDTRKLLEDLV